MNTDEPEGDRVDVVLGVVGVHALARRANAHRYTPVQYSKFSALVQPKIEPGGRGR